MFTAIENNRQFVAEMSHHHKKNQEHKQMAFSGITGCRLDIYFYFNLNNYCGVAKKKKKKKKAV